MMAKKKGAGGKLSRSEIITVRLDPKLRFAAELAARKQRRTLSSFVEWAVEEAVARVKLSEHVSIKHVMDQTWDVEEADRFIKLAINFPELLTFDEEKLWKLISEHPYFWYRDWDRGGVWKLYETWVKVENLREQWNTLNRIINEGASQSEIPDGEEDPNAPPLPDAPF